MSYIASNGGLTYVWHDESENYQLQVGEIDMGLEAPTEEQLSKAFPNYLAARAALDVAPIDALVKLKTFVASNPDVVALLK